MPQPAEDGWLPLYRAVLEVGLGVRTTNPEAGFGFVDVYEWLHSFWPELLENHQASVSDEGQFTFALILNNSSFYLYASQARIAVDVINPPQRISYNAWNMHKRLSRSEFENLSEREREIMVVLGKALWETALVGFEEDVKAGSLHILGRVGSPLADFQRIPSDVWDYLKVVDWSRGTSETTLGEHIYSLHASRVPNCDRLGVAGPIAAGRHRRPARGAAREAIAALFPNGVPGPTSLENKRLIGMIEDWCASNGRLKPSADTILRAAGRRD